MAPAVGSLLFFLSAAFQSIRGILQPMYEAVFPLPAQMAAMLSQQQEMNRRLGELSAEVAELRALVHRQSLPRDPIDADMAEVEEAVGPAEVEEAAAPSPALDTTLERESPFAFYVNQKLPSLGDFESLEDAKKFYEEGDSEWPPLIELDNIGGRKRW